MPYIILPSRWTQQPQGPVEVDWGNPLAARMTFLYNGAYLLRDFARRQNLTGANSPLIGIDSAGLGFEKAGSTAHIYADANNALHQTEPISVFCYTRMVSGASGSSSIIRRSRGSQVALWGINGYQGSSDGYTVQIHGTTKDHNLSPPTFDIAVSDADLYVPRVVSFTFVDGALTVYNNGIVSATDSGIGTLANDRTDMALVMGASYAGEGGTTTYCKIYSAGIWNRALSDAEHREIAKNPWQIFRPIQRRIYVPVQAGGSETVTPGTGALTITGHAPTAITPIVVQPGAGALAITGLQPALIAPQLAQPGVGALTVTGHAPTVLVTQSVQPGVASLSIAGHAPTLIAPQLAQPGAGALTVTGHAPSAVVTAAGTVLPGLGELTITGHAPTVVSPLSVAPGYADLSITGFAPTLIPSVDLTVTPGVADLIIVGHAPVVEIRAPGQQAGGRAKGKRVRPRIIRDEQVTPEERRRLGIPEPQEAAPEAEQAPAQPKRAKRAGKASRGIQLQPEPDLEAQRAAEILAQRTAELMAQQQAATEAMRAEGMAMLQAAAAIEADNELMMLLLMAA